MMSPANLNSAFPPLSSVRAADRAMEHSHSPVEAQPPGVALRDGSSEPVTPLVAEAPGHTPVLWPVQIDPVAVHAAVLIAQEAYRNQKALEGLAMLVQVSTGAKADVSRPIGRAPVPPPSAADAQGNDGFSR